MTIIGSLALSALAISAPQDDSRSEAARAQIRKEVLGDSSSRQEPKAESATAKAVPRELAEDPIFELLQQLPSGSPSGNRDEAVRKLRALGTAVRPVLPRYLEHLSPFALKGTLEFLLEEAPDANALAALEQILDGADPVARVIVARHLNDVRGPAKAGLIDRALASSDTRVRDEALRSLAQSEQPDERLLALLPKLATSANSEERRLAAELSGMRSLRTRAVAAKQLDALLVDRELDVRRAALDAWFLRGSNVSQEAAVALYERLPDEADRNVMLYGALSKKKPWHKLFERGLDQVLQWPEGSVNLVLAGGSIPHLSDAALAAFLSKAGDAEKNLIAGELKKRGSSAGIDAAVASLDPEDPVHGCFEYVAAIAPLRLIPLGEALLGHAFTWPFYAEHGDARVAAIALERMLRNALPSADPHLARIVRERSDASNFESLLSALREAPETKQFARPWKGAVVDALVRLAGRAQVELVLRRLHELDHESLYRVWNAIEPHLLPEHAAAVSSAARRLANRFGLFDPAGSYLASKASEPGRTALRELMAEDATARGAWSWLMRTASEAEKRSLLLQVLTTSSDTEFLAAALHSLPLVAVDPELRVLAAAHLKKDLGDSELPLSWARALPAEVREAQVKELAAALRDSGDATQRQQAIRLLGGLRGASVVQDIASFLDDGDSAARKAAVTALLRTGETDAIPHLIEALRDAEEDVRKAAKDALESLRLYLEEKERWEKR